MEQFLLQSVVQAAAVQPHASGNFCGFWNVVFWLSFLIGIIGSGVLLFMKRPLS